MRDSVVLCCAQWCQMQRTPRGKLLKLKTLKSKECAHNAEVVSSSLTLATNDPVQARLSGTNLVRLQAQFLDAKGLHPLVLPRVSMHPLQFRTASSLMVSPHKGRTLPHDRTRYTQGQRATRRVT